MADDTQQRLCSFQALLGDARQGAALEQRFQAACGTPGSPTAQLVNEAKARALLAAMTQRQCRAPLQSPADLPAVEQQQGYAAVWDVLRNAQTPAPPLTIELSAAVAACLEAIRRAGGQPLIVGGAVRDALLGARDSDLDLKVAGLTAAELEAVLVTQGRVHPTSRTFEVRLRDGAEIDVNIARGATPDEISALEADLTINALLFDPLTGTLIDPYGGVDDLRDGVLRHVSAAFSSDPVRMLRAMRFAARWGFRLAPETAALGRQLVAELLASAPAERAARLPRDRVRAEWLRFADTCRRPSAGLRALVESDWIALYPELAALLGCPQDPQYHPEGDVLAHTGYVADAAVALCDRARLTGPARQVQILAALGHDLGKSVVSIGTPEAEQGTIAARMRLLGESEDQARAVVADLARRMRAPGRVRSPGHAEIGEGLCAAWLDRIGCPGAILRQVLPLVRTHMRPVGVPEPTPRMVRKLARDLDPATLDQWALLVDADASGRPPLPPVRFAARWLALAEREGVDQGKLAPLLRGADVLAAGVAPGPAVGQILRLAEEAQINGEFVDRAGALAWLARYRREAAEG